MRRIAIIFFALLVFPVLSFAQSADFQLTEHTQTRIIVLKITWTADGSGAVSADFDSDTEQPDIPKTLAGRTCVGARTIPATAPGTPPTAYDAAILTEGGLSVFGTRLDGRSATVEQIAPPLVSSETDNVSSVFPYLFTDTALSGEIWTFSVTGAGAGGQGTMILIFR